VPASRPGNDVMRIRPVDLAVAASEAAAFVSNPQRPPHRRRDSSRRPPDVDHHRVGQQHTRHRAVASNALSSPSGDGQRELEVGRRRTQLVLQAFQGHGQVDVRPHAMAARQRALVHCVHRQLTDRIGHPLRARPLVFRSLARGQHIELRLESGAADRIKLAIDRVHAVSQLADVEVTPGKVGLRLLEEAVRVGDMPGHTAELAQPEDRVVARIPKHLVLIEELRFLAQPLAQVAESRGGLKGDLARAERRRHLGQRLQLLADTEPVGRRSDRHAASAGDPGTGRDVAADQMLTGLLGLPSSDREVAFQ